MSHGLKGKVALVTGARYGLGQAIAIALAQAEADVVITSRQGSDLDASIAEIGDRGSAAVPLPLDVRSSQSVDAMVTAIGNRFGRVDIVVNNAGFAIRKPLAELADDEWDDVVDTNLGGTFRVLRGIAPLMTKNGDGRIVNISSTHARIALQGRAAYGASKAGVEQLTRTLAVEWAPMGVTVNAIAPTLVLTESRQKLLEDPAFLPSRIAEIPLGRVCEPQDVADAVLFLAGPHASYITGNVLVLDGGLTLQ